MLQVPQHIWNAVAKSGTLKTALMQRLCAMTDEQICEFLDKEGDQLEAQGFGLKPILAMQMLRPSLTEPLAVEWMAAHFPGMEQAQPIVHNLSEAWRVAKAEYGQGMTQMEETQTIVLLKKLLASRKANRKQTV